MSRGQIIGQLPPELAAPLRRFVVGRRVAALLRSLAIAVLLVLLWIVAWGVVDRFAPLPATLRALLGACLGVAVVWVMLKPIAAIFSREIQWLAAARQYERRDPRFRQSLVTVVSQSLASPDLRGSGEITKAIHLDVVKLLDETPRCPIPDRRAAARAWGVACLALAVFSLLAFWPWLDLPTLLVRQMSPFASAAAVTTTRIILQPGAVEVVQGNDVPIIARVENPGRGGVILRTSTDGRNWTSTGMALGADGLYLRTLSALSRDARYEVRSGDASAGPYSIRVSHHPVVRAFQVRLVYPSYVGREPLTMNYSEGEIEAPIGTRATLIVRASEPLRSAWFSVNGQRTEAALADDSSSRQLELKIDGDKQVLLEMVSERGVSGTSPAEMVIRAIADKAPFARLLAPPGFTLLEPRSSVQMPYEAVDDYAIADLEAIIDVDGEQAGRLPLKLEGDPHHQDGDVSLRLSDFNLHIGQVVTLTLRARDRASQAYPSAPWRILVSPETVLPDRRRRTAELKEAAELSASAAAELVAALAVFEEPAQEAAADQRKATARLTVSAERAALLIRSILRAGSGVIDDPSARLYWSLADSAQVLSARAEALSEQVSVLSAAEVRSRTTELHGSAAQLNHAVWTAWQGESADLILSERRSLVAAGSVAVADLAPLREAIDSQIQDLGLEPRLLDVDQTLRDRASAMKTLSQTYPPADLVAAAGRWASGEPPDVQLFPQRLSVAIQAESARASADVDRVRDLQMSLRAVRALDRVSATTQPAQLPQARRSLGVALDTLLRHGSRGEVVDRADPAIELSVQNARRAMAAWAGEGDLALALVSTTQPGSSPVAGEAPSAAVNETRDQALATIRRIQQLLVEMPQLLADVEQAGGSLRGARARLREASREAEAARPEDQPSAVRAVAAAQEIVNETVDLLSDTAQTIDFTQPAVFARQLRAFLPDTAVAVTAVEQSLGVALAAVRKAIDDQSADEIERSIAETRRAIALVQQGLHDSRQTLLARDPVLVARSFAATTRPSTQAAVTYNILQRSWDQTIRRLSEAQLAVPIQQQTLLNQNQIAISRPAGPATTPAASEMPQRILLRPWRPDDLSATLRDADPPQYRESLDAYFRVLGGSDSQAQP